MSGFKKAAVAAWPMRLFTLLALGALLLVPTVSAFDSGDIAPGGVWSMTFPDENPGGYSYHCHPHPFMTGMVHVMADTDGKVTTHSVDIVEGATIDDWGYDVQHLEIEVGDTVVWTNRGVEVHTVTEMMGDGHGHDHDHGDMADDAGQDSPFPWFLGLLALAFVALRRRA